MRARSLAALLALLPLAAQAEDTPPAAVAAAAARVAAFPAARGVEAVEAYTPAEVVKGGAGKPFPVVRSGQPGVTPAALDAAEAYAKAQNSYALIVLRDGRVVRETYWDGATPATRYATASMHKTVMGLAYGPAIAAGKIALGDPVGKYLKAWASDPRGKITIGQLLAMASGLEVPAFGGGPASKSTQLQFSDDIRAAALRFDGKLPPGTEFAYGNSNSELAGLALSEAVGKRYADWLSAKIWKPIGASDAMLWLDRPGGDPHYYCCLQTTPRDWARVGELIRLNGKAGGRQLVPASWVAQMAVPSPLNPNYGLQLWRGSPHAPKRTYSKGSPLAIPAREPFARDDVVYLDGAGAQRVYVVPSAGLTVVRIGKPSMSWDDSAMLNMILAGLN